MKSVENPVKSLDPDAALDLSKPPHDAEQSQDSLVSLILKAARSRDSKEVSDVATDSEMKMSENSADQEETNHVDGVNPDLGAKKEDAVVDLSYQTTKQALDNVDSPTTLSRKKLGFSGSSAFAPVRAGGQSIGCIKPKSGPLSSASMVQASDTRASAEGRVIDNVCNKPKLDQSSENTQTDMETDTQTDTETDSLPEQVKKLSETFEEINRLVVLLEKASRSALQDIRRDK